MGFANLQCLGAPASPRQKGGGNPFEELQVMKYSAKPWIIASFLGRCQAKKGQLMA
jgi:hypothetical protein